MKLNRKSASWHVSPSKLHLLKQLVVDSKRIKLYIKILWEKNIMNGKMKNELISE